MTTNRLSADFLATDGKEQLLVYKLHERIKAFTTTAAVGRDADKLCPLLGVPTSRFARPHQVHTTNVLQIDEAFMALDEEERKARMEGIDAVIYDVRNACIGISTADCIPVVCYDPIHHVAAAIHAGWRGTVERIAIKAIEAMSLAYSTTPADLLCAIGPGISYHSFEVGDEVYEAFRNSRFNMETLAGKHPSTDPAQPMKWHINLHECNRQQLCEAGVKAENIYVSDLDTMTDDRFFSARRDGAKTGRMLTGIVLM